LLLERDKLAFEAIAKVLTQSGTSSIKGCELGVEHVFSVYKRGKLRMQCLTLKVEAELLDVWFYDV
jgi:hypothetical protein